MTTRHVERLIDFNHEMLEPLQFHIDEDIHYKKEEVGIRASGYLYLSGKYKAQDGIRLFQELLEVDILAPHEKIADESSFAVHVKDYDYTVRDGDLLIDITIEIDGLDEKVVPPTDRELDDDNDMNENNDTTGTSDMNDTDSKSPNKWLQSEMEDIEQDLDDIENDFNEPLDEISDVNSSDEIDELLSEKEDTDSNNETEHSDDRLDELPEINAVPDLSTIQQPPLAQQAWNVADLMAYENDNTTFGLDFKDQQNDTGNIFLVKEQRLQNQISAKKLAEMLQQSSDEFIQEPVRIQFELQEPDDARPVVATVEQSAARQAWKMEVARLQKQAQTQFQQPPATQQLQPSPQLQTQTSQASSLSQSVISSYHSDELAELIRQINAGNDLAARKVPDAPPKLRVNQEMIHQMNQSMMPDDTSAYTPSARQGNSHYDIFPWEQDKPAAGYDVKLPDLDVPFTRETVFPWERQQLYDRTEISLPQTTPTLSPIQERSMRFEKERKGVCMNSIDSAVVSSQNTEMIDQDMESPEMKELLELLYEVAQPRMEAKPIPVVESEINEIRHQNVFDEPKVAAPIVQQPEATAEEKPDVTSIEDLFEDADSKIVNMKIVIARTNDTYESIASRYQVNDKKLAQVNHNKPIYERTLIVIPLD